MKYENRDELIAQAKELREQGLTYRKIANTLGVKSENTVRVWIDKEASERESAMRKRYADSHKDETSRIKKEYYNNNKDIFIARAAEWGKSHPDKIKKIRAEYRESHREELRAKSREYEAAHKKEKKQRYIDNRDAVLENCRIYRERNKEEIRARKHNYYLAHKEEIIKKNLEYLREHPEKKCKIQRRYRKAHKEEILTREYIRKERIKEYDDIAQSEYDEILNKQNGLCIYCGGKMLIDGNYWRKEYCTIDHVYPINKGGAHVISNLVYACRSCNSSKSTKTIEEWRPDLADRFRDLGYIVSEDDIDKVEQLNQLRSDTNGNN